MTELDHEQAVARLREWARGSLAMAAGVELLVRAFDGRFAYPWAPWVISDPGGVVWVDVAALRAASGLSGGERRILTLAAALLDEARVDVVDVVTGLDRANLHLALAALAHAAGSHEGADVVVRSDGRAHLTRPRPLMPWPA